MISDTITSQTKHIKNYQFISTTPWSLINTIFLLPHYSLKGGEERNNHQILAYLRHKFHDDPRPTRTRDSFLIIGKVDERYLELASRQSSQVRVTQFQVCGQKNCASSSIFDPSHAYIHYCWTSGIAPFFFFMYPKPQGIIFFMIHLPADIYRLLWITLCMDLSS